MNVPVPSNSNPAFFDISADDDESPSAGHDDNLDFVARAFAAFDKKKKKSSLTDCVANWNGHVSKPLHPPKFRDDVRCRSSRVGVAMKVASDAFGDVLKAKEVHCAVRNSFAPLCEGDESSVNESEPESEYISDHVRGRTFRYVECIEVGAHGHDHPERTNLIAK